MVQFRHVPIRDEFNDPLRDETDDIIYELVAVTITPRQIFDVPRDIRTITAFPSHDRCLRIAAVARQVAPSTVRAVRVDPNGRSITPTRPRDLRVALSQRSAASVGDSRVKDVAASSRDSEPEDSRIFTVDPLGRKGGAV
jgi:hypothetical protein